ncbi:MAG: efflux RND transporter permease subunit [Bacteroidota bacterium]
MKLSKIAVDNYQFTIIVFVLLTIFGISSFISMPRTENPTVFIPGASVIVVYPGANPSDMEELVAIPIEEAINELDDIIKINTKLLDGIASISVEFSYNTDAKEKYNEVIQQVNSIRNQLPQDIFLIDYWKFSSSDVAMLQLALVSDKMDYCKIKKNAEKLKKEIEKTEGVKKVEIVACPEREVRVSVDLEKMALMNISLEQVANAIISNNVNIPGGSLDLNNKNFNIKTSGSFQNLNDLGNTVVNSYNGRIIYLREIAKINFGYEDEKYIADFNGKKAVFIVVKQKEDLNIFEIVKKINPKLENFRKQLGDDIKLETVFDQSVIVDNRISGFLSNLLQGILLVGIIIFLSMGYRSSFLVVISIPLSIIIGLGIVDSFGIGLQQITIAALVVALGMLVDNSIVIVENINRFIAKGGDPGKSAVNAASQIGWPIISSTVTTLLAFIPIAMMPDKAGDFIKGLPLTVIATLTVSLFVALTLTPMIAGRIFKRQKDRKIRKTFFEKFLIGFIEGPYRRILNFSLRKKYYIIIISFIVLSLSVLLFITSVGISFFPSSETPQFMIRAELPEGTNIDRTKKAADYIESVLNTIPEIKHYAANIGHGNPRIYYNVIPKNYSKNYADIYVELKEYNPREFNKLIIFLRKYFSDYSGGKISLKVFEQGIPIDAPIVLYINGENLNVLEKITKEFEKYLGQQPGVLNVDNQLSKKRSDIFVDINRDKAGIFGVPIHEIDKTIRTAINGTTVSKFRNSEGKEFNIVLRMPFLEKISASDFDKIYVRSLSGKNIPLSQLTSIKFKQAPSQITRYNLQRTGVISADLEKGYNLDEVMKPVIEELKNYPFMQGYGYTIRGELEARDETFGGMEKAMIIAIIAIFAVLVLQFRSFKQPLIIFAAIPLAIIGSVLALFITGYTFSFTAFVGLVSLIGIVVNNSIILVDYINVLRKEGIGLSDAIKRAGEIRFTPIILTSLTTVVGLLPLTISGSEMWAPLGLTLIGGLIVSTMLTLIVVPVLYLVLNKDKNDKN